MFLTIFAWACAGPGAAQSAHNPTAPAVAADAPPSSSRPPGFVSSRPPERELALAEALIPALRGGRIISGSRTALGTSALAAPAATERWGLLRVDHLSFGSGTAAVVWLVPESDSGELPFFVCPTCAALVLPALFDTKDRPVAVGPPTLANGQITFELDRPIEHGKQMHFVARRYKRHKGAWQEDWLVWAQQKSRLSPAGELPLRYTNEGVCGRVAEVATRGKPVGAASSCPKVWHFHAKPHIGPQHIELRETLEWSEGKRWTQDRKHQTLRYTFKGGRWTPKGRSLRDSLPPW